MTEIKIKRLCLENFKCHKNLVLDLQGGNASIYGDNASGKTSIYDALTWLLFGKDSQGNGEKNIEIKPLDHNGEVADHEALTAVEALLLVNGEEMRLRRTYREVWTTKRGSSEATYYGNTSEYYVDGVPCKRNAFQDKVNALVSEDTFRMLTSISYFASQLSWQDRRAVLFRVAGVMEDAQILSSDPRFAPLAESLGRLTIEEYKKKLLAEKRGFVGAKTELPARISECQKTIEDISGLDFAGAKAELARLQMEMDRISAGILAIDHDTAAEQKRLEIREAQLALSALESENRAHRAGQNTGTVNLNALRTSLNVAQARMDRKNQEVLHEENYLRQADAKIAGFRSQWIAENGTAFDLRDTCPTCGQRLPQDQLQKAQAAAQANKQKRLDEILANANHWKESKVQAEDRLRRMQEEVHQAEQEIQALQRQIAEAEAATVTVTDLPDYAQRKAALTAAVNGLSGELADMMQSTYDGKSRLQREKMVLQGKIAEQQAILSKESLLEYSRKRVEDLREEAKTAAACLEAIEKMLFLMEEYIRYKTRFVEDSINQLFHLARFRLFREQANGGIEDRCDVVYDGVPYISVNNGMKINLGIDIINILSMAYGVKVPLFVDNAESVTNMERCGSQIIRLVVSAGDKELRVQYEN